MICPLIGICQEKVPFEKYRDMCTNMTSDEYVKCPTYKTFTSKTATPSEWQKSLSK